MANAAHTSSNSSSKAARFCSRRFFSFEARARALHQLPRPLRETTLPITSCGERDDLVASNNTHHIACIVVMDLSRRDRDDGSARISTVGAGHRGNSMYGEARMDTHAQKRTLDTRTCECTSLHRSTHLYKCSASLPTWLPAHIHTRTQTRARALTPVRLHLIPTHHHTPIHPPTHTHPHARC